MSLRVLQLAFNEFNHAIARARADYALAPNRACGWRHNTTERCDDLRDTDNYYCPRHRRARDEMRDRRARKDAA